jgi:hypothetical protein
MSRVRPPMLPAVPLRWMLLLALPAVALMGCAPEVVRQPTQLTPLTQQPGGTIEILEDVSISVGPGYQRTIGRGTVWTRVGRSAEGEVFKPVDRVFTVEGAHIHEAYLVLDGDRVVGFYLPVERAFSPAPGGTGTRLSIRRREP